MRSRFSLIFCRRTTVQRFLFVWMEWLVNMFKRILIHLQQGRVVALSIFYHHSLQVIFLNLNIRLKTLWLCFKLLILYNSIRSVGLSKETSIKSDIPMYFINVDVWTVTINSGTLLKQYMPVCGIWKWRAIWLDVCDFLWWGILKFSGI